MLSCASDQLETGSAWRTISETSGNSDVAASKHTVVRPASEACTRSVVIAICTTNVWRATAPSSTTSPRTCAAGKNVESASITSSTPTSMAMISRRPR